MLAPLVVRPQEEGGYEIISGHRRQRESILPSERAFAYKMKLEALKH